VDQDEPRRLEAYGNARSAVRVGDRWLLLSPQPGRVTRDDEPVDEVDGLVLITIGAPLGGCDTGGENDVLLSRLHDRLSEWGPVHDAIVGFGDGTDPRRWAGSRAGCAARMSREEAAMVGSEFGQEAVFAIEGAMRVVVSCVDAPAVTQRYRATFAPVVD
jgi:hypothetical protein